MRAIRIDVHRSFAVVAPCSRTVSFFSESPSDRERLVHGLVLGPGGALRHQPLTRARGQRLGERRAKAVVDGALGR